MCNLIIEIHNGLTWTNDNFNKSFLGIPKCASSGIREELGLFKTNDINVSDNVFSVMRDPIKRYVSGYIEAMKPSEGFPDGRYFMSNIDNDLLDIIRKLYNSNINEIDRFKKYTDLIVENGFFEPHIVKQIDYLRDLETKEIFSDIEIFKLEKIDKLNKFLGKKLSKRNVCEHLNLKNNLTNFIKNNQGFKEILFNLYQEDLDLYNSFEFNKKIY